MKCNPIIKVNGGQNTWQASIVKDTVVAHEIKYGDNFITDKMRLHFVFLIFLHMHLLRVQFEVSTIETFILL